MLSARLDWCATLGSSVTSQVRRPCSHQFGWLPSILSVPDTLPPVAFVRYHKASSAARAIEALHGAVLGEGSGPRIKVFLAEQPSARYQGSLYLVVSACYAATWCAALSINGVTEALECQVHYHCWLSLAEMTSLPDPGFFLLCQDLLTHRPSG